MIQDGSYRRILCLSSILLIIHSVIGLTPTTRTPSTSFTHARCCQEERVFLDPAFNAFSGSEGTRSRYLLPCVFSFESVDFFFFFFFYFVFFWSQPTQPTRSSFFFPSRPAAHLQHFSQTRSSKCFLSNVLPFTPNDEGGGPPRFLPSSRASFPRATDPSIDRRGTKEGRAVDFRSISQRWRQTTTTTMMTTTYPRGRRRRRCTGHLAQTRTKTAAKPRDESPSKIVVGRK